MTIAKLLDFIALDDLTVLRSLSTDGTGVNKRVDKDIRTVRTTIAGYPSITYQYNEGLSLAEQLPGIVKPTDNLGNWVMVDRVIVESTALPTSSPAFVNSKLIVTLTSPNRQVVFESRSLSSPAVVADWKPVFELHNINIDPEFAPDYQGQQVLNTTTGKIYLGLGTAADASSWTMQN